MEEYPDAIPDEVVFKQVIQLVTDFTKDYIEDECYDSSASYREPLLRLCEKVYEIGFALGWCSGADDASRFLALPKDKQNEVAEKLREIIDSP